MGAGRLRDKWNLAAPFRAFSGFPRTPVLGRRVSADETRVIMETPLGGERFLEELEDDPLPRIC